MNEHEITETGSLLSENGSLREPGWARVPLLQYERKKIEKNRRRIKEWDYVLTVNEACAVALTLSDLGYVRMVSATFIRFDTDLQVTKTSLLPPKQDFLLPDNSAEGQVLIQTKDIQIIWKLDGPVRHLYCFWKDFYKRSPLVINLSYEEVSPESMNIATPFDQAGCFYYNRKHNCLKTSGTVGFHFKKYAFKAETDLSVLDWGRGIWPYKSVWYWGTGSGYVKGKPFGFNIGHGFGNTAAATENCFFWNGKLHKLGQVDWQIPSDPMDIWVISEEDGRFDGVFTPDLERSAHINALVIESDQHQFFGHFSGTAKLENGREIKIHDFPCSLEKVKNKY